MELAEENPDKNIIIKATVPESMKFDFAAVEVESPETRKRNKATKKANEPKTKKKSKKLLSSTQMEVNELSRRYREDKMNNELNRETTTDQEIAEMERRHRENKRLDREEPRQSHIPSSISTRRAHTPPEKQTPMRLRSRKSTSVPKTTMRLRARKPIKGGKKQDKRSRRVVK